MPTLISFQGVFRFYSIVCIQNTRKSPKMDFVILVHPKSKLLHELKA